MLLPSTPTEHRWQVHTINQQHNYSPFLHVLSSARKQRDCDVETIPPKFVPFIFIFYWRCSFSQNLEKNKDYLYFIHDGDRTVIRQVNTNLSDWYLNNVVDYYYWRLYYRIIVMDSLWLSWIPGNFKEEL